MIKNRMKKCLAIMLGIAMAASYAAPALAAESASYEDAQHWYDSIPEMLSAGEYEEGVVVAGIISEKKSDYAAGEIEEILEVTAGVAEVTPKAEEVSISLIRRDGMTTEEILRELAHDSSVVFAEPNYVYTELSEEKTISLDEITRITRNLNSGDKNVTGKNVLQAETEQKDPVVALDLTGLQWGNSSSATMTFGAGEVSINVPDFGAEGSDMTGDPITVAVFDTAIDFSHPDLKDVAYTFTPEDQQLLQCDEHGYNGLWDAEDEKLSYSPGDDHGTHCAGIIGASWDGHGISGVASNVRLVSVEICAPDRSTSLAGILRGMDFVRRANELTDADIRITSNSWGLYQNSRAYDAAVRELGQEQGVITIVSAGNDGFDISQMNYTTSVLWDNPYVISVAATDLNGNLASYSTYGNEAITLAAPGSGILSTVLADEPVYIPDAVENKYYNGFEEDQGVKILQTNPMERITEDPVETDICNDIGYSGTKVLRLGFNKDKPFFQEGELNYYDFYFELGDISNLDVKPGDQVGFALESADKFVTFYACCYDSDGNELPADMGAAYFTSANTWETKSFAIPEGADLSNFGFSFFVAFYSDSACDQMYIDSIGIGSECVAYGYKNGTSMACPAVSGAAAVIASRFPEARGTDLAALVKSSVRSMPSLKDTTKTGGIIDLSVDLSNPSEAGPVISSLETKGNIVTLIGRNFGKDTGSITLAKEEINGKADILDAIIVSWTDKRVVLKIKDMSFMGIMSAELTSALNGKKDRIQRLIRKSSDVFELEYYIDYGELSDPFSFDSISDLETDGVLRVIGDTMYFMPEDRRLEEVPVVRRLYSFDLKGNGAWKELRDVPDFMEKVSSAAADDGRLYIKGIPMDDVNGYAVKKDEQYSVIVSYDPVKNEWTDENADDVGLDDTLVSDGENIYLVGGTGIRRYDPGSGVGETLFTFDSGEIMSDSLKAEISEDNLYLFDGVNYRAWVVWDIETDPIMEELILPEAVNEDFEGAFNTITLTVHGGALAAVHDGVMLIGPAAVDGSVDTFVVKNGSTEFEPYDKKVSDGRVVAVSAVSDVSYSKEKDCSVERVYVIATSVMDEGKIIFRATDYYSFEKFPYSNEWVDGKWYNKDGSQTYSATGSWKKNNKGIWYEDTKGWYPRNRWQKIDGKWYYFKSSGYAAVNEFVQGWWVGSNGAWNDPVHYSWHKSGSKWWYGVIGGWYAKNKTYTIDGIKYSFDQNGYMKEK